MILTKKCPKCKGKKYCLHCANTGKVMTLFCKCIICIIEFIYYLFKKKGVL